MYLLDCVLLVVVFVPVHLPEGSFPYLVLPACNLHLTHLANLH